MTVYQPQKPVYPPRNKFYQLRNTFQTSVSSLLLIAGLLIASLCSVNALAQNVGENADERANVIEEIVVTATKRQANLQDVPMSITAITEDNIVKEGIEGAADFVLRGRATLFDCLGL